MRRRRGQSLDSPMVTLSPKGSGYTHHSGYRYHTVNGRRVQEHRLVMERELGRPLDPLEEIHHKNGIRDDNDPSNLELWVKPQPAGQRVDDLVQWVVEHYPDLVRKKINER